MSGHGLDDGHGGTIGQMYPAVSGSARCQERRACPIVIQENTISDRTVVHRDLRLVASQATGDGIVFENFDHFVVGPGGDQVTFGTPG